MVANTSFSNSGGTGTVGSDGFVGSVDSSGTNATTNKVSVANGLTAHAGGGQGSALALTASINRVTTVGTAADSVALPAAVVGASITVINAAASNSMQVFGAGTDTINSVATATGVAQAAGKTADYYCAVAGNWDRLLSA